MVTSSLSPFTFTWCVTVPHTHTVLAQRSIAKNDHQSINRFDRTPSSQDHHHHYHLLLWSHLPENVGFFFRFKLLAPPSAFEQSRAVNESSIDFSRLSLLFLLTAALFPLLYSTERVHRHTLLSTFTLKYNFFGNPHLHCNCLWTAFFLERFKSVM